jgi:hypothetical protein
MFHFVVKPPIDLGNLLYPPLPFSVFQAHDLAIRPMKVVSDVGYLLKQPF